MNANTRTVDAIMADLEQEGWTERLFLEVCAHSDPQVIDLFEKYYATFKSVVEFGNVELEEFDDMDVNSVMMHQLRWTLSRNSSKAAVEFLTRHKEFIDWYQLARNESAIDLLEEFYAGLDMFIYNTIMSNPVIAALFNNDCMENKYDDHVSSIKYKFLVALMENKKAGHIIEKYIDGIMENKNISNIASIARLNPHMLKWEMICSTYKLNANFINEFAQYLSWVNVCKYQTLSEDTIIRHKDSLSWWYVCKYQSITFRCVKECIDCINRDGCWNQLCESQTLSEEFMDEYADHICWNTVSRYQTLSEDFIFKHAYKVDWKLVSWHQVLSEDFIRELHDFVDWEGISLKQRLGERFIYEFQHSVCWMNISHAQSLGEEFIREFKDHVDWDGIVANQTLSDAFKQEMREYIQPGGKIDDQFARMEVCDQASDMEL